MRENILQILSMQPIITKRSVGNLFTKKRLADTTTQSGIPDIMYLPSGVNAASIAVFGEGSTLNAQR